MGVERSTYSVTYGGNIIINNQSADAGGVNVVYNGVTHTVASNSSLTMKTANKYLVGNVLVGSNTLHTENKYLSTDIGITSSTTTTYYWDKYSYDNQCTYVRGSSASNLTNYALNGSFSHYVGYGKFTGSGAANQMNSFNSYNVVYNSSDCKFHAVSKFPILNKLDYVNYNSGTAFVISTSNSKTVLFEVWSDQSGNLNDFRGFVTGQSMSAGWQRNALSGAEIYSLTYVNKPSMNIQYGWVTVYKSRGNLIEEYVNSTNKNQYPENGLHTDGYWYTRRAVTETYWDKYSVVNAVGPVTATTTTLPCDLSPYLEQGEPYSVAAHNAIASVSWNNDVQKYQIMNNISGTDVPVNLSFLTQSNTYNHVLANYSASSFIGFGMIPVSEAPVVTNSMPVVLEAFFAGSGKNNYTFSNNVFNKLPVSSGLTWNIHYTSNVPSRGNYISTTRDIKNNTYPDNGLHTDGYWYTKKSTYDTTWKRYDTVQTGGFYLQQTINPGVVTNLWGYAATEEANNVIYHQWYNFYNSDQQTGFNTQAWRQEFPHGLKDLVTFNTYQGNLVFNLNSDNIFIYSYTTKDGNVYNNGVKQYLTNSKFGGGGRVLVNDYYTDHNMYSATYGLMELGVLGTNINNEQKLDSILVYRNVSASTSAKIRFICTNRSINTTLTTIDVYRPTNIIVQGNYIDSISSPLDNAYPNNGIHTDGYWYVKQPYAYMQPIGGNIIYIRNDITANYTFYDKYADVVTDINVNDVNAFNNIYYYSGTGGVEKKYYVYAVDEFKNVQDFNTCFGGYGNDLNFTYYCFGKSTTEGLSKSMSDIYVNYTTLQNYNNSIWNMLSSRRSTCYNGCNDWFYGTSRFINNFLQTSPLSPISTTGAPGAWSVEANLTGTIAARAWNSGTSWSWKSNTPRNSTFKTPLFRAF